MKISYRREMKHNYLILDSEDLEWDGYECRMLVANSIEGILRFQLRQIDEKIYFYYEITSKQPLARVLEGRTIRVGELRSFIIGIAQIVDRMEKYLLKESSVMLTPEYLYIEPENFRVWFCLIPGIQRNFPEDYSKLLEYLLGKVDHQDKDSVVLAYALYQETRKADYGMNDILRILQTFGYGKSMGKSGFVRQERSSPEQGTSSRGWDRGLILEDESENGEWVDCRSNDGMNEEAGERQQRFIFEDAERENKGENNQDTIDSSEWRNGEQSGKRIGRKEKREARRERKRRKKEEKQRKKEMRREKTEESGQKKRLWVRFRRWWRRLWGREKGVPDDDESVLESQYQRGTEGRFAEGEFAGEEIFQDQGSTGDLNVRGDAWGAQNGNSWENMFAPEEDGLIGTIEASKSSSKIDQGEMDWSKCSFSNVEQDTLVLGELNFNLAQSKENHRLLALDPGLPDIELRYYPFVIGKQENLVDFVLERDVVSRLHMKIDLVDSEYTIEDLNSTNGTFVAGKMLEANETVTIREGDEVKIADCRYRFVL